MKQLSIFKIFISYPFTVYKSIDFIDVWSEKWKCVNEKTIENNNTFLGRVPKHPQTSPDLHHTCPKSWDLDRFRSSTSKNLIMIKYLKFTRHGGSAQEIRILQVGARKENQIGQFRIIRHALPKGHDEEHQRRFILHIKIRQLPCDVPWPQDGRGGSGESAEGHQKYQEVSKVSLAACKILGPRPQCDLFSRNEQKQLTTITTISICISFYIYIWI